MKQAIDPGLRARPGRADADGLVGVFEALLRTDDFRAFERAYLDRAAPVIDMPMAALYMFGASRTEVGSVAADGVSDYFVTRYEEVRHLDFILDRVVEERRAVANTMLMPVDRWRDHDLFRDALRLHEMILVIQAPVVRGERVIGTLNWGSDPRRGVPTRAECETATALGRLVGAALDVVRRREEAADAQEQLCAALDASSTPIVITDADRAARHLNASARALLDRIAGGVDWIDRLTTRVGGTVPPVAECDVPLARGGRSRLVVRTRPLERSPSTTVSIIHLEDDAGALPPVHLTELTAREREVAALIAEALTDAEIAERLGLSPHTIREYLKTIYRKVGVSSRVGLARLVLTVPAEDPAAGAGDGRLT